MNTDFLWVEQYRPKTIDDCILPDSLKTLFSSFVKKGNEEHKETMMTPCRTWRKYKK